MQYAQFIAQAKGFSFSFKWQAIDKTQRQPVLAPRHPYIIRDT